MNPTDMIEGACEHGLLGPWLTAPVAVETFGRRRLEVIPGNGAPNELSRLAALPDGIAGTFVGEDGDDAVTIRVAVLLPATRRILLEARLSLRLKNGSLYFDAGDLADLHSRRAAFEARPRHAPPAPCYGMFGRRPRPLVDQTILEKLGWQRTYYDPNSHSLAAPDAPADRQEAPGALLFWDTRVPASVSLKLEPTTKCTFKCKFCYGRYVRQGTMTVAQIGRVLAAFPDLEELELFGEGEGLLLPEIPAIVRAAAARGIKVRLGTNGSLLTPAVGRELIEAGLSELTVSLETLDPERFSQLRPKGDLDAILRATGEFAALRRQLGRPVTVKLWMTVLRESIAFAEKVEALARTLDLDGVEFQTLNPQPQFAQFYDSGLRANMLSAEELKALAGDERTGDGLRQIIGRMLPHGSSPRCSIPTEMVRVGWQGNVTPCCNLQTPSFASLGNLLRETWPQIVTGERYSLFRFATSHAIRLDSCRSCPLLAMAA